MAINSKQTGSIKCDDDDDDEDNNNNDDDDDDDNDNNNDVDDTNEISSSRAFVSLFPSRAAADAVYDGCIPGRLVHLWSV